VFRYKPLRGKGSKRKKKGTNGEEKRMLEKVKKDLLATSAGGKRGKNMKREGGGDCLGKRRDMRKRGERRRLKKGGKLPNEEKGGVS